mgnify:CR=1 FL=1
MDKINIESDLKKLEVWVKTATRGMNRETVDDTLKTVALDFERRAADKTPVDTGRAKGAWRTKEAGKFWDVVNGVPYIVALEFGLNRPNAGPAAMVRRSLAEIRGDKKALRELNKLIKKSYRKARF